MFGYIMLCKLFGRVEWTRTGGAIVMDRLKVLVKLLLVDEVRFMRAVTADMMP